MPISNTTAKDFENLISYLNSSWNVLLEWYGQFFLYHHSFAPKNGCKVGQYKGPNRPKNRVFGLLRKIDSLVFARNGLKWSVLWLTLCANAISGKTLILEIYMQKLSTNQIAQFFKLLYLLNRSTVFYNFLHKDRIP